MTPASVCRDCRQLLAGEDWRENSCHKHTTLSAQGYLGLSSGCLSLGESRYHTP